jgi:D-alanyl-D-alanine carboxypeptidase
VGKVGVELAASAGGCRSTGRIEATTGIGVGRGKANRAGRRDLRVLLAAILLASVSGCASGPTHHAVAPPAVSAAQLRDYAPPGPAEDPWGPYIREAARRYELSETWIRAVMRQESGGQEFRNGTLVTSPSGAIGLMQVMPETYAALRDRYGLGPDPYDPRDNILAGTAYLRELYDRFGAPGFLAAYNAGPQRLNDHLATGRPLPAETIAYVAAIGPRIGAGGTVPAGARATYAGPPSTAADALNRQALATATGARVAQPAPASPPAKYLLASAAPVAVAVSPTGGGWGIQVGAFSTPAVAQAAADSARGRVHGQLDGARVVVPVTTRPDGAVLYRARLLGISADAASDVCNSLARDQVSCIVIEEDRV